MTTVSQKDLSLKNPWRVWCSNSSSYWGQNNHIWDLRKLPLYIRNLLQGIRKNYIWTWSSKREWNVWSQLDIRTSMFGKNWFFTRLLEYIWFHEKRQVSLHWTSWSQKHHIYRNLSYNGRLQHLMKMFSGDPLLEKIPYSHYNFLPTTIYVTYEFDPKEFYSHYRKYEEKDTHSNLLLKIDRIVQTRC
jgi:hypothetical protein